MTNEQVIKRINEIREILADYRELTGYDHEALDIAIYALSKQSASSEQVDQAWEMLMGVHDMPDVPDKAKDIIGDVMLMLHQMIIRADESIITDFVAYQRERLRSHKIMELNSVDEAMTHIFIGKTGKAYIEYLDKLGQFEVKPGKNGEDRTRDDEGPKLFGNRTVIEPGEQFIGEDLLKKALDQSADSGKTIVLKKRTIIERLTIAQSLIDSVIADSDNDQFREDTKKTDDVLINLPSAQPEIIRCNSCKHWTQTTGKMKGYGLGRCDFHDADLVTCNGFCYWAERRNDG